MSRVPFVPRPETVALAKARQHEFEEHILPAVQRVARKTFKKFPPHVREDLIQEALARAWWYFLSMLDKGMEPLTSIGSIAKWSVGNVLQFKYICGTVAADDTLNERARRKHHLQDVPAYLEEIGDDHQQPIPDQVAFRLDFAQWRASWDAFHRAIIDELATGDSPRAVAQRHGLSNGRMKHLRCDCYRRSWEQLHAER